MTLERTAVRSNISANQGGGLSANTDMQIINVTFSNNHALLGGALYSGQSGQTINIVNSTFNENQADTAGAIYRHSASTVVVKNSILTGSLNTNGSSPSLNCDGPSLDSLGHNIISDNSCFPNPGTVGDLFGTDPLLGPWLASPIRAYIPNANSPAVDYGLDCPAVDQRGYPRPLGAACDVGSIERGQLLYLPLIVR
ncbi:MAG: choice-of-anchor Q domain-containing protein [Chloroflexota bacterium]